MDDVRLEVLLGDGTRLVVLIDPLGGGRDPEKDGPGAIRTAAHERERDGPARGGLELTVRSDSQRIIRVSSHHPFHRVNPRLVFDREVARGYRLDLPAGASERWSPGETRTVRLVRYGGEGAGETRR